MFYSNPSAEAIDCECVRTLVAIKRQMQRDPLNAINAHLIRYAVVVCTGAIEQSFKTIIADHVANGATPEVMHFIDLKVRENSCNPWKDKMAEMLKQFCDQWKSNFNTTLAGMMSYNQDVQALKSLVTARNQIAHGKSVSCTFLDVVSYYLSARRIVKPIEFALT